MDPEKLVLSIGLAIFFVAMGLLILTLAGGVLALLGGWAISSPITFIPIVGSISVVAYGFYTDAKWMSFF